MIENTNCRCWPLHIGPVQAEFFCGPDDGKPQPIDPTPQVYAVVTIKDLITRAVQSHDGFPFPASTLPGEILTSLHAKLDTAGGDHAITVHFYRAKLGRFGTWILDYEGIHETVHRSRIELPSWGEL